jgi:DNA-binding transcriptional MerR regulator
VRSVDGRRTWTIGELAGSVGVSVRTLHHYDRIGLVRASARTAAGHRRYGTDDRRRLRLVLALRRLGLDLGEIGRCLDAGADPRDLARHRLDRAEADLDHRRRALRRLAAGDDVLAQLEETAVFDDHLTPDQLDRLDRQQAREGFAGMDRWRADAGAALAGLDEARRAGRPPAAPEVQALVARIRGLKRQLVGTDADVAAALRPGHDDPGWAEVRALLAGDPERRAYWRAAKDAS